VSLPANRVRLLSCSYAFGTATQALPVPELIPFRLTRQVSAVLLLKGDLSALATVERSHLRLSTKMTSLFRCGMQPVVEAFHQTLPLNTGTDAEKAQMKGALTLPRRHCSLSFGCTDEVEDAIDCWNPQNC